jgi:hypothetical protein
VDYFSKGAMLRMEPEQAAKGRGGGVVIQDNNSKKMIVLMDAQKSYMEMPIRNASVEGDGRGGKKARAEQKAKVTKTGKTETILGYSCEQYLVKSGQSEMEVWITKDLGPFFGMVGPGGGTAVWEKEAKTQGGFPMRVIGKDKEGKEDYRMDVTKVEKKTLSASLFAPPSGYKKMDMPMGMPFGR